ncbi:RING/FYVE/PHD zinc finger superfamily protein isoform 2 [Hibiscus syriacus]|uniref:RING/FYVE/PHD zinc finger superfamily protein isoform 2 n=1 Tax=Hibiscus syriacus TaxID=106335 RepID=A0A6A3C7V2_HIBSY|nr:RING/FYVE/PHD zinc finger superfamily protein isoform 2 [Hibiscus syriacus]
MSDHLVLYVDLLVRPVHVHPVGLEAGPSTEISAEEKEEEKDKEVAQEGNEEDPLIQARSAAFVRRRIPLTILRLLVPAMTASMKCVQHWCNEKGDITCEICHQISTSLMPLLLLRHTVTVPDADSDDDFFLLRAAGLLLPCYIMAWAINPSCFSPDLLSKRVHYLYKEAAALAATQIAFVVQSGQRRGVHFAVASGPAVTPHQENV